MQDNNLSNVQLGKEIGISDETIRKWRNGQTIPPIDKAKLLANYFHISLDSLMGEPIYTEQMVTLPLVGAVSAGSFEILNEDDWTDECSVSVKMLQGRPQKECCTIEVIGDSMSPHLLPGDILIVHRQTHAVNGNIVVTYDPTVNGYTVKKFAQNGDTVTLSPYNKEYKPMQYTNPSEQQLMIYGVCVGLERKLVEIR
jgi:SOS-response transcriptional repressor LexA